jgi:hypothetical protein
MSEGGEFPGAFSATDAENGVDPAGIPCFYFDHEFL